MTVALVCAGILLLANLPFIPPRFHSYISAAPLAAAGISYALLQLRLRPQATTLWKRLLLAATFLTWAVDQLLPAGPAATAVGDAVIAAYVLDLYWLIQEQMASSTD